MSSISYYRGPGTAIKDTELLFYSPAECLEHDMQPGHAERSDRLRAITRHLKDTGLLDEVETRTAQPINAAVLEQIHDPSYLQELARLSPTRGLISVDPDTAMNPHSLNAAAMASGAVVDAVQAVQHGSARRAFCAVRPPGHHAESDAAMGFCFYNSIALGAQAALNDPGTTRVAILDFDVHHGNGTVEIFKDRPEVLVCSSFQHPFYPHRYFDTERPNIVNTPLAEGTDGTVFRNALERDWLPALERHQPELILVSAGFDAHRDDPLAGLNLTEADFRWITELIVDAADRSALGRIVSALEGGYDLNALARSVHSHLEVLAG